MSRIKLNAGFIYCYDCVRALRKFIGSMKGVRHIEVENGLIRIDYDEKMIEEESIKQIAKDAIERLGYKLIEEVLH